MIRLANSEYLYLLLLLPLFIIIYLVHHLWKKKQIKKWGDQQLISRLFHDVSSYKPVIKFLLLCLALTSLIIGVADPQIGSKLQEVKREGVDIMIALDVSNSMKAQDIRPDRLERAKQAISKMIDKLQNDRVGIIVFAGRAYTQLPLTTDFGAAKLFLSTINTEIIPTQGTAIGAAIQLAQQSMDSKDNKHKVLVIITDGENHEDDAIGEAKKAVEQGTIIHTIGMGSLEGGPIPVHNGDSRSNGYLKDNEGKVVVTKLDESMLQQIASAGKGKFIRATNADDGLSSLLSEINKMEKKNFGTKVFTDYEDRFQYFVGFCFLILLLDLLVNERQSKWFSQLDLFGTSGNSKQNK